MKKSFLRHELTRAERRETVGFMRILLVSKNPAEAASMWASAFVRQERARIRRHKKRRKGKGKGKAR